MDRFAALFNGTFHGSALSASWFPQGLRRHAPVRAMCSFVALSVIKWAAQAVFSFSNYVKAGFFFQFCPYHLSDEGVVISDQNLHWRLERGCWCRHFIWYQRCPYGSAHRRYLRRGAVCWRQRWSVDNNFAAGKRVSLTKVTACHRYNFPQEFREKSSATI
jgi:hypothetical protein